MIEKNGEYSNLREDLWYAKKIVQTKQLKLIKLERWYLKRKWQFIIVWSYRWAFGDDEIPLPCKIEWDDNYSYNLFWNEIDEQIKLRIRFGVCV